MSGMLRGREKNIKTEFIKMFCETKMNEYTTSIFQAFYNSNWDLLEETSMKYEADCYNIGAIEIVGKLIKLRLQLQEKPVDRGLIERTLNGILENSLKVQQFLVNQLQNSECPVALSGLIYVSKPINNDDHERRNWFHSNCNLQ